jgi:hypothetical protein
MRRFDKSGISMKLGERGREIRPKILGDVANNLLETTRILRRAILREPPLLSIDLLYIQASSRLRAVRLVVVMLVNHRRFCGSVQLGLFLFYAGGCLK